ncbi:hypothetical protein GF336_05400 [Candidatus Woesearchaeota archaeon]|nr:hypothetical protein [Candidatus Woesearchaeota archaeon]
MLDLNKLKNELSELFPIFKIENHTQEDLFPIIIGLEALTDGGLSWTRLNQILYYYSQAAMSHGFFRYYFLEAPSRHPYPVSQIFENQTYKPPNGVDEIKTMDQLKWGLYRFFHDAMLYWGNFHQAYAYLHKHSHKEIESFFESNRFDERHLITRGSVAGPEDIPFQNRYLVSERACEIYNQNIMSIVDAKHVKYVVQASEELKDGKKEINSSELKVKAKEIAEKEGQLELLELMYEDTEQKIIALEDIESIYTKQKDIFNKCKKKARKNTDLFLSCCNDLDVYVATSMRRRKDFEYIGELCEGIFRHDKLKKYDIRYFDPTLSVAKHHEDKGIIECLMVKTSKLLIYLSQYKESLGKVSEYAMALSLGKPVIVLCPSDEKGIALSKFYKENHPLMRLVEFQSGIVCGAMITYKIEDVIKLIDRIFSNKMEYSLCKKKDSDKYYLLKERLTGSTVRAVTDNTLLTKAFWNNYHQDPNVASRSYSFCKT